ncbi:hypothetical protein HBI56_230520 [Parastagonospora nodorum]|uniref:Uncharacterized protein n=1 Tax=Phaeosphaeria nodorum (strain SN15 / ATCC MYA-4574 / FGSC 10173) TaxID=321614 RepID=A0A7U2FFM4_PHANO|nr:hypothetical protein HBH56_223450 [Parastagonospora nodorum]QRD04365.1 hypothetical protein JI435_161100 [Parastagonospora nodorum SN15]KAH3921901.1 hypothetical protein HBH54_231600 [Parastagonospora nodorum]KAH3939476.1 hypothetical protein HBH53_235190 [Parastagonospora nodorum]KAH3957172.1 hypothetical protein HBH51_228560 [Parastagonospora nodorum]
MSVKRKATTVDNPLDTIGFERRFETSRVLRGRVAPKHEYVKKTRHIIRHREIDFSHIVPTNNTALFFQLPRELRDMVYQFLWLDAQIHQRYKKKHFIVTYGDQGGLGLEDTSQGKAPWLLTNKQMMLEGLAEFHRRAVWIFESWGKTDKKEYIFPLIKPALVHEQHLYVDGTGSRPHHRGLIYFSKDVAWSTQDEVGPPHIVTLRANTIGLVDLMSDSVDAISDVRKVKIYLQIHDQRFRFRRVQGTLRPWNLYHVPDIMFDFTELDRLAVHKRLQVFEVEVQVFKDGIIQSCANLDRAMANLITELKIVGKALLPEGKFVQTESQPGWPLVSGVKCISLVVS